MGHHSFTEVDHLWTFERRAEMHEVGESRESGAQTAERQPPAIHTSTVCALQDSVAQYASRGL